MPVSQPDDMRADFPSWVFLEGRGPQSPAAFHVISGDRHTLVYQHPRSLAQPGSQAHTPPGAGTYSTSRDRHILYQHPRLRSSQPDASPQAPHPYTFFRGPATSPGAEEPCPLYGELIQDQGQEEMLSSSEEEEEEEDEVPPGLVGLEECDEDEEGPSEPLLLSSLQGPQPCSFLHPGMVSPAPSALPHCIQEG